MIKGVRDWFLKTRIKKGEVADHKRILITLTCLLLLMPALSLAEGTYVLIKGVDDGIKTSRQQDYLEALIDAKIKVIKRAGMEVGNITKVVDFELKYDMVEGKSKEVLLPGF